MNTYCKRRNKSSYRKYIMFYRKKYQLCLTGKISLVKNFFLWQDISYCDRNGFLLQNIFPVAGNYFSVTENFLQWQKISSCERRFLPVTGIFLLWQDFFLLGQQIPSCDRKFLPVTAKFALCQGISSCDKNFLQKTGNFFQWHEKFLHTISFWGRNIILVAGTFCDILFHLI